MNRVFKTFGVLLLCGIIGVSSVKAEDYITYYLLTDNPFFEHPSGYAGTSGYQNVYASITVSKSGYKSKFADDGKYSKKKDKFISAKTDNVWGPTWKAAGTKFVSKHTGYTKKGAYKSYTKTAKY